MMQKQILNLFNTVNFIQLDHLLCTSLAWYFYRASRRTAWLSSLVQLSEVQSECQKLKLAKQTKNMYLYIKSYSVCIITQRHNPC